MVNKKVIVTTILFILFIVLTGALSAPLGVPLLIFFSTGGKYGGELFGATIGSVADFSSWCGVVAALATHQITNQFLALWIVIIAVLSGVFLLYKRLNASRRVAAGKTPLGNAKIEKGVLALRAKNDFWNGRATPKYASLVLGATRWGYYYDHSVPHWLVVGKTGSGKDQLQCIETLHLCMASGFNLLVTGKSELLELTGDKAIELGYRRVVFDLNGYPGASCFNPIDLVASYAEQGNRTDAQKAARQMAADFISLAGETNTYFPKTARAALTALILLVAYADIPRDQKNMASVYDIVAVGTTADDKDSSAPLKDYIRNLGPDHPAYGPAAEFLSDGGLTTAGKNVVSTLKEALTIFGDEGIRYVTSKSDISMEDLIQQKSIVYFHLPEENDPYIGIFKNWFNSYWKVACAAAQKNGGRLPRETAIVGNEFGNLGRVDCLPQIATLGRSMKLHAWIFLQDLKQLSIYDLPGDNGAGRDKILGSIGGKVALSLANPDDCAYFTKLVGKRTVRTYSAGKQYSGGITGRLGRNKTYSEKAEDLIHPWEWSNRVAIRDGSIVIKGGENAAPGHEGVFEMPLNYANKTPAGSFFGLGTEDEERQKRIEFYQRMLVQDQTKKAPVKTWLPNFDNAGSNKEEMSGLNLGNIHLDWDRKEE